MSTSSGMKKNWKELDIISVIILINGMFTEIIQKIIKDFS